MTLKAVSGSWLYAVLPYHLREREKAEAGCWRFLQITLNGSEPELEQRPHSGKTTQGSIITSQTVAINMLLFWDYKCGYHPSLYQISPGKLLAEILWGCSGVWLRKVTVFIFLVWPLFTHKCPIPLFVRLHSRPQSKHGVYFLCKQCYKWRVENICFENSYLSSETKKVHSLSIGFSSSEGLEGWVSSHYPFYCIGNT